MAYSRDLTPPLNQKSKKGSVPWERVVGFGQVHHWWGWITFGQISEVPLFEKTHNYDF